jgi:IclR family pca regulon transcriptional regulator
MTDQTSSEYLSTLEKGLRVLRSFSKDQSRMTLSEVARATELSPAVARRCLITLLELGYVGKVDNLFFLKPKVLELSTPFVESFNIDNIIRPPLQQLRDQTGDSASFAVLSGNEILYITHVSTYRVIRTQAATGTRFPALATSLGRAILSALPEGELDAFLYKYPLKATTKFTTTDPASLRAAIKQARSDGFAVVSDQLDYGITSIATPVVLPNFGVVGAINCSSSTGKVDLNSYPASRSPALFRIRDQLVSELKDARGLLDAITDSS